MAIRKYSENGKQLFEVYVTGFNSQGVRIQRKRRNIETLRKAETLEYELTRELDQLRNDRAPLLWKDWFAMCIKRMKMEFMPSTIAGYETQVVKWVHPHWENIEIQSIKKSDVYELIFQKCEGFNTQITRLNLLKRIKRLFQMAVEEGIIDRNPCVGISIRVPEAIQKVLTSTEVDIFLREAKHSHHRFYPVWAAALMTGMRSGELYALKWTDIDFDGRTISVSKAWNSKCGITPTKTKRSRIVPNPDDLTSFIKEEKSQDEAGTRCVLPRLEDWDHGDQARVTRAFCVGLGITSVKFHDLRATFITNLLARGESLARVMSIVGHSELKTTNGYLRKAGVDVQGGTDKLGYKLPTDSKGTLLTLVRKGE